MEEQILNEFTGSFERLNIEAKSKYDSKKIFTDSDSLLGYYEPSLTVKLVDQLSREGRFIRKEPRHGKYFIYWYDSAGELIKVKFIDNKDEKNTYDVFPVIYNGLKLFLFYDLSGGKKYSLSHYYILEYKAKRLIKLEKSYARGPGVKRENEREEYKYDGGRLVQAHTSTAYIETGYKFYYGEDGYLDMYERYDPSDEDAAVYKVKADKKDIQAYEKFEMFHFSPLV